MEHRWNETDGGKSKYSEKNLFQCHFVHHKSHMDRDWTRASAVRGRRITAWAMTRLWTWVTTDDVINNFIIIKHLCVQRPIHTQRDASAFVALAYHCPFYSALLITLASSIAYLTLVLLFILAPCFSFVEDCSYSPTYLGTCLLFLGPGPFKTFAVYAPAWAPTFRGPNTGWLYFRFCVKTYFVCKLLHC